MKHNCTRRSFLKNGLGITAALLFSAAGGKYYSERIETKWIDIQHHTINNNLIPKGFSQVKIAQFSDTHLGFQFQLEDLLKTVQIINRLQPDLIIFTGDLMDRPNEYKLQNQIPPILKSLKAPLGKFCIYGNHDHGGYGSQIYRDIMYASGFQVLLNSSFEVKLINGDSIYIAGIDDAMLGKPDVGKALADVPKGAFTILLSHAPDYADQTKLFNVPLQLSGHSHGGQVQIPFYGALVKPPFAEKYYEGFYQLEKTQLYVNRGLGTTRMPYRFLSRPEITIFELNQEG